MPELPEVETVMRGLALLAPVGTTITKVHVRRRDLRIQIPRRFETDVESTSITGYRRWGKYLLWKTTGPTLLSHLGMSGIWRDATDRDDRTHDHVYLHLSGGKRLAYHDPRRFGFLDLVDPNAEREHPSLRILGPDALDESLFHPAYLAASLRRKKASIKTLLLDQRLVAGIGNIYAVEALFRAGIRPRVAAGRVTRARLDTLVTAIREILGEAICDGGSTLRDFRQAGGESGYFQTKFRVYGREGDDCHACGSALKSAVLAGRATVWCAACQH